MKHDRGEAERLVRHPLLAELFETLEKEALEAVVNTDDPDRRAQNVWEVRALRAVREKLTSLALIRDGDRAGGGARRPPVA